VEIRMIDYSPKAQYARALLLRRYNDILVFVEDPSLQFMYVRVINRILGSIGKVENTFGLGGRAAVIEACLRNPFVGPKPALYLVDGDLDLLTGNTVPLSPRLHRIDAYSVENILLDSNSISEIAAESVGSKSKAEVEHELELTKLATVAVQLLMPLFVVYAASAKLNLPIPTVSFAVVRLCLAATDARTLSRHLVRERIRDVRRQVIAEVGISTYRTVWREIAGRARTLRFPLRAISGKSYLLPLLVALLGKEFRYRDSSVALRCRLAQHLDRNTEPALSDFILKAIGPRSGGIP
jgi:hypothetical protein